MQGYRTFIVAGLSFLVPMIARWGFHVDVAIIADSVMIGVPALMAIMRAVTHSSPGQRHG